METTDHESGGDEIHALLVDDNEGWVTLLAKRIERSVSDITVSVATDANEAIVRLQERDRLDCLVVDYMMPGVTGLELLERIREDRPDLPFIIATSEGNEEVATRAMDAGVTDYVVKEPEIDQTALFTETIQSAVEQHRLQRALEESEQRYRTVVEQSRDAIGILTREGVRLCNQRFADLTGRDCDFWNDTDFVETAVHPDDREAVRTVFDGWYETDGNTGLHETRIRRPDGEIRRCEFTGQRISATGGPSLLLSIRDVSNRRRRERELRWERDLNRTVQMALVESRTRRALERDVVEHLNWYGYRMAWIAERGVDGMTTRAIAGDRGYISAIDRANREEGAQGEPVLWAARTDSPQFVHNIPELFSSVWRDAALDHGYRSGAAVPLVHNDVRYGVLGVYHERTGQFDETERRLLLDLADTVAFGIHSLVTENTLATERPITATVSVSDETYYLADLAADGAFRDCDEVQIRGTVPHGDDAVVQYLLAEGSCEESILDAVANHSDVDGVYRIDDEPLFVQVTVTGPTPEAHLATRGSKVNATRVDVNDVTVVTELPSRDAVTPTVETLQEEFADVSVLAVTEGERTTKSTIESGLESLTNKQAEALRAAYHHGYFDQPRKNTATMIADSLDISHSTFLQHLHRAEEKIFREQFGSNHRP